ncbi:signal peptidase II [Saccharibacillus qingshengii]|uniref:signal peptidase II n=1 Tax=Saccharibacillus qingshengii TaxID=1763540 RepID=UPI00248414A2|nr:signal peptidase II [Saccharibacillus qingshengii]
MCTCPSLLCRRDCRICIDQLIKWSVATYLDISQKIPLIPGFIQLTSIRNRGSAFGILQNQWLFFIVVTAIVLIGIIIYLRKIYRKQTLLAYALALIFGAAMGNFVDRGLANILTKIYAKPSDVSSIAFFLTLSPKVQANPDHQSLNLLLFQRS